MLFHTILADPPWKYGKGWGWGAGEYYNLMTIDEIIQLPVPSITAANAHLYLWSPNGLVPKAILTLEAWGFVYKTMITWVKSRSIFGYYFKGHTEQLLFGVKGSLPVNDRTLTTKLEGQVRRHSQKPESTYKMIEKASPEPRIEMFAREQRDYWYCIGSSITGNDILEDIRTAKEL